MKMLLTKKFAFEMAHALEGYDGKCANLHGHSYHMEVTVKGTKLNADGMAIDFGAIKRIVQEQVVDRFDHALVLKEGSSLLAAASEQKAASRKSRHGKQNTFFISIPFISGPFPPHPPGPVRRGGPVSAVPPQEAWDLSFQVWRDS